MILIGNIYSTRSQKGGHNLLVVFFSSFSPTSLGCHIDPALFLFCYGFVCVSGCFSCMLWCALAVGNQPENVVLLLQVNSS